MADRGKWTGAGRRAPADAAIIAGMLLSLAAYYVMPTPLLCLPPLLVFGVLAWFRLEAALCRLRGGRAGAGRAAPARPQTPSAAPGTRGPRPKRAAAGAGRAVAGARHGD